MATLKNTSFTNITLPSGTTAQRPGPPTKGMFRFNTDMAKLEFYNGSDWKPVTGISKGDIGSGGTIRYVGNDGGRSSNGIVHLFTSTGSATFTPAFTGTVEVLVVAAGGSGGSHWGGGGGGGGVIYNRAFPVSSGTNYPITVGTGGTRPSFPARGNAGGNSVFSTLTASGGGGGGSWDGDNATGGGSGGGAANGSGDSSRFRYEAGKGNVGEGFPGGTGVRFNQQTDNTHMGGGGGGAGGPGIDASDNAYDGRLNHGGPGLANNILGHTLYWGGGGGSTAHLGNGRTGAAGGIGGGGGSSIYHGGPRHPGDQRYGIGGGMALNAGGAAVSIQESGTAGTNTGGGGGGHNYQYAGVGGEGAPGIVIIRY